ncbi:MAG: hypothetical protein EU530_09750 [Promethearchaeota archaeon]|nr:MAG: hypothetical protein EU530_09750 [Candidatus Lokiarchaeota archaeon]
MGKGKLVAGIILLIIGVGLIPASFGMNNLLIRRMDESIGTSFYSIQGNLLPYTFELTYAEATPPALLALKAVAETDIPGVVNGSVTYYAIRDVITDLATYIGETNATELFFNDPAWTVNTDSNYSIIGISEYSGLGNLSFTKLAISRTYAKFKESGHLGIGVLDYLSDYEDAISSIPTRDALTLYFNSTWEQISNVSAYIYDYIFPQIPTLGGFPYAATPATAEDFFFMQWVNSSIVPGTWRISVLGTNYNIWEYKQYDLRLNETRDLWDPLNTSAPLNDEGIFEWYYSSNNATLANELTTKFNLNQTQYENLMRYFFTRSNKEKIFGPIYAGLQPYSISTLASDKVYLQWANGEYFPNGIAFINLFYEGFEVSFPPESVGIDVATARLLWNGNTLHGLANTTGVHLWFELARSTEPDTTVYNMLRTEFGLTTTQMDEILTWLIVFEPNSLDILNEDQDLDYHPEVMAQYLTTGSYITAGIIGFIGLMFTLTSFKKER